MKRFDWRSGILGAVTGVGMVLLIGAAGQNPDDGRYQLSDNWSETNGGHGVYRIDTRTGEVMEIVGGNGTRVPQTEIHAR